MEMVRPSDQPEDQPRIRRPFEEEKQPEEQQDGIRMVDPNSGQPLRSELDQVDLPPMNDYLRAIYQLLVWGATSFQGLARSTPALTSLNPDIERTVDQIATLGYQVTNGAAEASRALWNWPYSRVIINKQLEHWIHPQEWSLFDTLYMEWYKEFVEPVEAGVAQPDSKKLLDWVKAKEDIADPQAFLELCANRLRMERAAQKSAWSPTELLSLQRPTGERQKTTTGLERVFRRKPG